MKPVITLVHRGETYEIPNAWSRLTPDQYLHLVADLLDLFQGKISPIMLRLRFVCHVMHWRLERFASDEERLADLLSIAQHVQFPLIIRYPDHEDLLDGLSPEEREHCRRTDPFLNPLPIAKALRQVDYHFTPDLCFSAQLLPEMKVKGRSYKGYTINTDHGTLTTSLTALQYIEATSVIDNPNAQPLLAAILYYPGAYSSEGAQQMANEFLALPAQPLIAIAMNFRAFCNFLFTKTQFSILTKFRSQKAKLITTDSADALYDLSADGLGNAQQVERLPLLTYLRILRKKTVDAVRRLHAMDYNPGKIANELGLPIDIITQII